MNLQRIHRIVGILSFMIFISTGVYLKFFIPEEYHANDTVRYLFRTNHIYILLACLLNLVMGYYMTDTHVAWRRRMQRTGSIFLLMAPAVLLAAFIIEPPHPAPFRPITSVGILSLFIAVACHWPARNRKKTQNKSISP